MEYAALRYAHPAVETVTKTQYWERRLEKERKKENLCDRDPDEDCFDIILSISSFEHDGLGRYGDPLGILVTYTYRFRSFCSLMSIELAFFFFTTRAIRHTANGYFFF